MSHTHVEVNNLICPLEPSRVSLKNKRIVVKWENRIIFTCFSTPMHNTTHPSTFGIFFRFSRLPLAMQCALRRIQKLKAKSHSGCKNFISQSHLICTLPLSKDAFITWTTRSRNTWNYNYQTSNFKILIITREGLKILAICMWPLVWSETAQEKSSIKILIWVHLSMKGPMPHLL